MYHLCDNETTDYCIMHYKALQFLDFYCAILTLWCTSIVLAHVPSKWVSTFHLTGSIFFAGVLIQTSVTGTWSFVISGVCSVMLMLSYWVSCIHAFRNVDC